MGKRQHKRGKRSVARAKALAPKGADSLTAQRGDRFDTLTAEGAYAKDEEQWSDASARPTNDIQANHEADHGDV